MAVERLYFRDTQTQANTGGEGQGSRWDLDPTAGSPATLDGLTNNNNTPVLLLAWHRTVGADVAAATFPVSLAVTAITNSPAFYLRAARYASDGTLADAGADGTLRTTTGTFTETLSLATTWDAGDQLVIELWGYRNAGHSASVVTIGVNQAGSYVDADLEAAAEPVLFAGAAIGSSATAGALSPLALLAGAAIGSSATSGVLAIEEPAPAFEGAAVGSSTARGALSPAQELEGAAAGSSAASGALSPRLALLGSSVGSSSSAGALSPSAALEGAAVGASSSAGELAAIAAFSGAAVGSSSGFGDLSPELETLSGRAIGSATAAGALSPASSLEGSALGSSAAAGALAPVAAFSGAAIGSSSAAGDLATDQTTRLEGAAVGSSSALGLLTPAVVTLAGAAVGSATAAGELEAGVAPQLVTPASRTRVARPTPRERAARTRDSPSTVTRAVASREERRTP